PTRSVGTIIACSPLDQRPFDFCATPAISVHAVLYQRFPRQAVFIGIAVLGVYLFVVFFAVAVAT
ncbi:hypothetical protein, partial [Pseudomonas lactis]|uniref:hypothetical protein n=1 Tax=Pseudomonas lactis TaxID=1615674 RepID=UPI001CC1F77E